MMQLSLQLALETNAGCGDDLDRLLALTVLVDCGQYCF